MAPLFLKKQFAQVAELLLLCVAQTWHMNELSY